MGETMDKLAIDGGTPVRRSPLKVPWPDFGDTETAQLMDVIRITREGMGKPIGKTAEFEQAFARFHQASGAVACTNCSQALEIMLAVAGIQPGDEVIVPPFTYVATAGAVVAVGAIPVFADIDPSTYQLDPESVAQMITSKTRAIIPVHFAGHFADMEQLSRLASKHNLMILEDAAQAHGARWNGRYPGQYGLAAGFSFQYGKNMTAQEGGVIISHDREFIERCWEYVWYGRKKTEPWYCHYSLTSNFRMTEFQGAILLAQLEKLPVLNQTRSRNAQILDQLLMDVEGVTPAQVDPRTEIHPRHLYPIRFSKQLLRNSGGKQAIVDILNAEGIPLLFGYEFPLYRTPAFREKRFRTHGWYTSVYAHVDYTHVYLPACEQACRDTAWLLHTALLGTESDMNDIALAMKKLVHHKLHNP